MKRWKRVFFGPAMLVLLGACSGAADSDARSSGGLEDEAAGSAGAALRVPVPMSPNAKSTSWDGSLVDLMVADTWSTCGFVEGRATPINHKLVAPGDVYLDTLLTRMQQVMAAWVSAHPAEAGLPALRQWIDFRNDASVNRNPATDEGQSAQLRARSLKQYALDLTDPAVAAAKDQANESVALAAMNACIAQGVRSMSLGGDMLVMSEAEQIQALEAVRERAQIAILQYAAIFNAVASPIVPLAANATAYQSIAYLQKWAASSSAAKATALGAWVTDFAGMLQLHLTVTSELADLFVRSAAAKSVRGSNAATTADEQWGAGSWRQRLMALLYGGDPLAAEANGSTPWTNMVGRVVPGVTLDASIRPGDPWPTRQELPYFTVDARDPHVEQLFALARQFDALQIKNRADGSADIEASAEQLYRAVDATLRTLQCQTLVSNACKTFLPSDVPAWVIAGTPTSLDSYALFKTHGITRDHARAAVRLLDQYLPMSGSSAIHLVGGLKLQTDATGTWRVAPRDVTSLARSLSEVAPLFGRYSPYRIPQGPDGNVERSHIEKTPNGTAYRVGDDQGLAAGGIYAESMRTFGAVPAISLARDIVKSITASAAAPAELKTALASLRDPLLGTMNAAIGSSAIRFTPLESVKAYDWANSDASLAGARVATERLQQITIVRSPSLKVLAGWALDVDTPSDTSFFTPDSSVKLDIVAVRNDPSTFALALSPTARRIPDGKAMADLAADTTSGNTVIAAATLSSGKLHAEIFLPTETLSANMQPSTWTMVARRTAGSSVTYMPITGATPLYTWQFNRIATGRTGELAPLLSYQFASGGRLGRIATQSWTVQRSNPSLPAYDGFGLPYTWVPAADATAFGSQPGDSVMTYFLRNAKSAAAEATDAVRTAIDSSFRGAQATLEQQAAQSRSDLVTSQEAQRLCGAAAGDGSCVPTTIQATFPQSWQPIPEAWDGVADPAAYCRTINANEPNALRTFDCYVYQRVLPITTDVPLANDVASAMVQSGAPTFDAYSGGEIQTVLVDQWGAAQRIQGSLRQLNTAKRAMAVRQLAAAQTLLQLQSLYDAVLAQQAGLTPDEKLVADKLAIASQTAFHQCHAVLDYMQGLEHWQGGTKHTGWSYKNLPTTDEVIDSVEADTKGSTTTKADGWSALHGLLASCGSSRESLDSARQEAERANVMAKVIKSQADAAKYAVEASRGTALSEYLNGVGSVEHELDEVTAATVDLARTITQMRRFSEEANLATQRQLLEKAISTQSAQLSLGLIRQYHQYDWWRARALLDGARRYAVAARRAIETNYVTQLDTLTSPEPFVAAPSAWAEDVYRYDLSMPSAVGLNSGEPASGAQYPNQVLDYVGNLERFVQGFAVERPLSAAADTDVRTIPGPGAYVVVDNAVVSDPARAQWSVLCPAKSTCTSADAAGWCPIKTAVPASQTCVSSAATATPTYFVPSRARISFFLDPWGQMIDRRAVARFDSRVNTRWGRFALNLVGNGIRDCSRALNPNDCQANQYLNYDLHHDGPSLAIGATHQFVLLDIPFAQVESAKAATLGEFLDVEQNAWGKAFVESIARTELVGRPMSGTYVLELDGGPTVSFDRLEAVQLLMGTNYWVTQR